MSTLHTDFAAVQAELNAEFPERRDAVEVLTLALLTGQHSFLLGPPGTGKSKLARRFVEHFPGARYFETLLSKNRPDAAVLGPYDMAKLREESAFVRKDEGYLTSVDVSFIDEIGKMSPTSGHDILAALNERIKHEVSNGRSAHRIPLHSVITASNELPAAESEDAAAMWDRLLFRTTVDYIVGNTDFQTMLSAVDGPIGTTIPWPQVLYVAEEVRDVKLTTETLDAVVALRDTFRQEGLSVSDRRWRDSMAAVRATAWLRGSDSTEPDDLYALRFTHWDNVETIGKVARIILGLISPENEEIATLADDAAALEAELESRKGEAREKIMAFLVEAGGKKTQAQEHIVALRTKVTAPRQLAELDRLNERLDAFLARGKRLAGLDKL